ncbi:MBL fold metallo-hydrolase [Ectopseudomonas mendocina]|uniref:Metallo-beta-lactamase domain-containing protein n=1 Tax=Ectopseudomonas mendocina S5.2 TaxID=1225174 RepID=A0ABN4IVA6_ECTME|nr:hypothetical protein [Pseudomonas mendocina]ALN19722.1 hypothetical protein DW68_014125 [Pseudomonas mendocina S5.2]KER99395.1 hypothetical protein HN51_05995 [Pseudomonas mendocina]
MRYPFILHRGAVTGVTASFQLMDDEHALLIDCDLFQAIGNVATGFPLGDIKALVATHVDIYYVDPLAAGFKSSILCCEPYVFERASRPCFSHDQKQIERYIELTKPRLCKQWRTPIDTAQFSVRIRRILGSIYVGLDLRYPKAGEKNRAVFLKICLRRMRQSSRHRKSLAGFTSWLSAVSMAIARLGPLCLSSSPTTKRGQLSQGSIH